MASWHPSEYCIILSKCTAAYLDVESGADDGGDAVLPELTANVECRRHGALADLDEVEGEAEVTGVSNNLCLVLSVISRGAPVVSLKH